MSHRYRHGMHWIRDEKRLALYMRDSFACLYCGAGVEDEGVMLSLDHVRHRGGNHHTNLVTACMDCNGAKGWKSLNTFLKRLPAAEKVRARVERALEKPIGELLKEAKAIRARRNEPF